MQESQRENDPAPRFIAEHAGNVAQTILIANQTVNLSGKPEWIQSLDLDQLHEAERRLRRASTRYESAAVLPLALSFATAVVMFVFTAWFVRIFNPQPVTLPQQIIAGTVVGVLFALQVWMYVYDVRRRSRHVVDAAERRRAEVLVEIALRTPLPPPPASRFKNWLYRQRNFLPDGL